MYSKTTPLVLLYLIYNAISKIGVWYRGIVVLSWYSGTNIYHREFPIHHHTNKLYVCIVITGNNTRL